MFWKYNNANSNHIDTLLNNQDVTLQELMEEEDILQECKSQNKKLIDFLCRSEVIEQLVTYITEEPDDHIEEKTRFKFPNVACELLTCEVSQINECLTTPVALDKLYTFLEGEPPLNPLLASFFSKSFGILVARKTEQNWYSYQITCLKTLEFFQSKENCASLLLKHLGTSAIMDLMLKLMTQIEGPEMQKNLLDWLEKQEVIPSLLALFSPSVDSDRHCNVSQLLCDVIRKSRENVITRSEPSPILDTLELPETVIKILDHMLGGEKSESSIVGGISVLLTLIETVRPRGPEAAMYSTMAGVGSTEDTTVTVDQEEVPPVVQNTTGAILPRLKDFHDLLLNPPKKPAVKTTVGTLDPPLGNTRLQVARLISALVATNSLTINQELANLGTMEVLLDLFFKYQWNNFLHTQVEQCLVSALSKATLAPHSGEGEPTSNVLIDDIFVKCGLLQRILDSWEENEKNQSNEGNQRRGYMGHVIKIANHIVEQMENSSNKLVLNEKVPSEVLSQWQEFVDKTLAEVNKTHNIVLGGTPPTQAMNMEKEESNYKNVPFPGDTSQHQAFTDYQLQDMAPTFTDNYGFHDNDFNVADNSLHSPVDRLPGMSFGFNDDEDDLDKQAELFKHICAKKLHSLEDAEESWWVDKNQIDSFDASGNSPRKWQNEKEGSGNSSSEEEEEDEEDNEKDNVAGRRTWKSDAQKAEVGMEVDTSDIWSSGAATIDTVADFSNPWVSGSPSEGPTDSGWADFSSFETNFSSSTQLNDMKHSQPLSSFEDVSPASGGPISEDLQHGEKTNIPERERISTDVESSASEVDMRDLHGGSSSVSSPPDRSIGVESDANANPTTCVEDVTPTATAIIDEVATAAVAAVRVVVADKIGLDNQRFLKGVQQSAEEMSSNNDKDEEIPSSSGDCPDKRESEGGVSDDVPSEAV